MQRTVATESFRGRRVPVVGEGGSCDASSGHEGLVKHSLVFASMVLLVGEIMEVEFG